MMFNLLFRFSILCTLLISPVCFLFSQNESNELFEQKIVPIFQEHCVSCHGEQVQMAGLDITSRESLLHGSENGSVVVPKKAEESLMFKTVTHQSEPHMPYQKERLPNAEIEALREWINAGAKYTNTITLDEKDELWSIKPLQEPTIPDVKSNWVRNEIDLFVLDQLYQKEMTPSHEADKRTLIRRVTYDLHGLPPTPDEVEDFLLDNRPDAYERVVDRLLASPRYGERWGRHWLDVVHYADTHGYDKDKRRPHAWRYRDYVIRSLNEDKPYGQFIHEQLAGDVLEPNNPNGLVSTGFISAGPWDYVGHVELREGTVDKKITRNLDRDNMLTNTMSTFMSLTVHCARCHDHKFDPITQKEYYQLQSVFAGVERANVFYDDDAKRLQVRRKYEHDLNMLKESRRKANQTISEVTAPVLQSIDSQLQDLNKALKDSESDEDKTDRLTVQIRLINKERREYIFSVLDEAFTGSYKQIEKDIHDTENQLLQLPPAEWVYTAASDFKNQGNFSPPKQPRTVYVLNRGEVLQPKEEVKPYALSCVATIQPDLLIDDLDDEGQRRSALARWISDPANAITWRSIVNRVWHYHFGKGIVDSPGDFGKMGSAPTHPELLDWLVIQFLENGQSLKWLHKLSVTSATYRQSSQSKQAYAKLDSGNRYLWRMNRQRLDAESVHDFTLAVSGKLDTTMYGPGFDRFGFIDDHSPHYLYDEHNTDDPKSYRRSVYRFIVRSVPDPFMQCLDAAEPSQNVHTRNTTLTALQVLATMNNPFMMRQSEFMAERLQEFSSQIEEQIDRAYLLALNRNPTSSESTMLMNYANQHGLTNMCRLILNLNEFMFID